MLVSLFCFSSAALAQDEPDTTIDWLSALVDLFSGDTNEATTAPSDFHLGDNLGGAMLDLNTRDTDSLPTPDGERWWRRFNDLLEGPRA